jgi:hypothetical protein
LGRGSERGLGRGLGRGLESDHADLGLLVGGEVDLHDRDNRSLCAFV